MLALWRKWIVYPLTWVVLMVLALIAVFLISGRGSTQPEMDYFKGTYVASSTGDQVRLQVTEEIKVRLSGDRGIERRLVTRYDGQSLDISNITVTNQSGIDYQVQELTEGSDIILRIGDPNSRLHGSRVYVISYTIGRAMVQDDGRQDLYFNVNGAEWPNGFREISATLTIDDDLAENLVGEHACYIGAAGSRDLCELEVSGNQYQVSSTDLGPYENITIAVGFDDGTVSEPLAPLRGASHGLWGLVILVGIGAAALAIALGARWISRSLGRSEKGVVTQFTPPKDIDPMLAADFLGRPEKGPAANLVYLVLLGAVDLVLPAGEQEPGPGRDQLSAAEIRRFNREMRVSWTSRQRVPSSLRYLARHLYGPPDGTVRNLSRIRSEVNRAATWKIRQDRVLNAGLRVPLSFQGSVLFVGFAALLLYGFYQVWIGLAGLGWWFFLAGLAGVMLLVVAVYLIPTTGPLTAKGRRVRRELLGLERFIMLAEADRIAWLQNVKDAPRDEEGRIKLYERLLPWAIVFGAERSWAQLVGKMHDQFPDVPTMPEFAVLPLISEVESQETYYDNRHETSSWFSSRDDIGQGPGSNLMRDLAESFSGRDSGNDSTRSSGRGWSGGSGGGGGSSGGGFSGGGVGGGGGGRW